MVARQVVVAAVVVVVVVAVDLVSSVVGMSQRLIGTISHSGIIQPLFPFRERGWLR